MNTTTKGWRSVYTLEQLKKEYRSSRGTIVALNDVNLTITRGEFVTVQGPTGGGKSTLLQMLGALDQPTNGRVMIDGVDLAELSESDLTRLRADRIGFVFQAFNLIPTLTALENVECALVPIAEKPHRRAARALQALDRVGLADRRDYLPLELSGGQQQRVAIARAIVKEPSVLLADEPTGNLDQDTRDSILAMLDSVRRDFGLTTILVTHDDVVAETAERRLRVHNGVVTELT